MKILGLLVAGLMLYAATAQAASMCTGVSNIGQTSVQIKAAGDLTGGRHYLSIQNMGNVVLCCGIGTANAVTATCTNGVLLVAGQMWVPSSAIMTSSVLPDGDASCIAPAGTGAAAFCDF